MPDIHLNGLHEVLICSESPSGVGFGTVQTTGASCVLMARTMQALDLAPGDRVMAKLVDNPAEDARPRTPYAVQYVDPTAEDD